MTSSRLALIRSKAGFSLVELSLVLLIVGILMTGGFATLKVQRATVKYASSKQSLQQIHSALLTYLLVNHHLPCPDTDAVPDGEENRQSGNCAATSGGVPYRDLGLNYDNAVDGWQYPIVYAVNQSAMTNACGDIPHQASNYFCAISPGPNFDLTTPPTQSVSGKGGYAICSGQAKDCLAGSDYYADKQVAVLVAFNQNGLLEQYHCEQQSQKEKENCDLDAFFWAGNREGQEGKFFDDQVLGVSSYQLKSVFLQHDPSALQPN